MYLGVFLDHIFQNRPNIIFQSTTDDEAEQVNGKNDMIEKSIKGSWAFNFWTKTFHQLDKNYNLIKNIERGYKWQ